MNDWIDELNLSFSVAGARTNLVSSSMDALKNASGKNFEIAWLSPMIEHHTAALEMARDTVKNGKKVVVVKKVLRQDLRKFAQNLMTVQTKEPIQHKSWLKAWK
jgi:uncharacterized protein (DUF305 family)